MTFHTPKNKSTFGWITFGCADNIWMWLLLRKIAVHKMRRCWPSFHEPFSKTPFPKACLLACLLACRKSSLQLKSPCRKGEFEFTKCDFTTVVHKWYVTLLHMQTLFQKRDCDFLSWLLHLALNSSGGAEMKYKLGANEKPSRKPPWCICKTLVEKGG